MTATAIMPPRSRAFCNNQREKPEDESKTRHHDWTKAQLRCSVRGVVNVFA